MRKNDEADLLWHTAFGVAYRILGLPWQAEDVAQLTLERWVSTDHKDVTLPAAFVARISANIALNLIRSEKRISEKHKAFGLPLPVMDDHRVETRIDLSYAMSAWVMHLPPFMRAVFVLRSAFDLKFEDIADALGKSSAACRQSFSRARRKLAETEINGRSADQETLVELVTCIQQGDEAGLIALMSRDIALESDGGASAPAFGKIVDSRERLARFLVVSPRIFGDGLVPVFVQSHSGDFVLLRQNGHVRLMLLASSSEEGIHRLFAVSDPEKLERL